MKRIHVLGAALILALAFAAQAHADDPKLFSPRRFSLAAQVGVDYWRQTNSDNGVQTKPAIKLVPSYALWGHPVDPATGKRHQGGTIGLNFPIKYGLNGDHPVEFGVYGTIIVWSGADQP